MYLELVIFGGKKEEETVEEIRKIVSDRHRGEGLLQFVLRNSTAFRTGGEPQSSGHRE